MGMFDKDRLYGGDRLDETFQFGDTFILHSVEVLEEPVPTEVGDATKTILTVSKRDNPGEQFKVGTLASAIAEKAREAEASDFPAVVKYHQVTSEKWGTEAAVISLVEPYDAAKDEVPF
jgi:hypothetical protein